MPIESGGAASLPLPNGASTLAEQQTQSTTISNIDTNTDGVEAKLDTLVAQGVVAVSIVFTEHTVTNASLALPSLTTPRGFSIQVPESALGNVFVRNTDPVTTTGVGRGWEIPSGTSHHFDVGSTTGYYAISTAASVEVLLSHEVPA